MIILTNPLLLEIVLGSSATTSQLPFYVAYVDSTSITYVPAQLNGLTNNTSIVTLVPTPLAGTSRTIKYVSIHNEDTVSSQVILQINDGVNTKIIVNFTLDSGDRLEYTDTVGFRCLTSTGEVKQGSGGGGIMYPGAGIPISTGTGWSTSITDNSTNWNTAYGWGNHASAGYLTGITSLQVTTALGYTPYDSANPSGYITASALSSYVPTSRTLTINGTALDLSVDRSWTIAASASLSGLTAATTSSTINNGLNPIEWQWNSLTSGTGLKLSSNSVSSLTGNTLLELSNSGTIANGQTTYALKISNTKSAITGVNYGIHITTSGNSTNTPIYAGGIAELARFDGTTNPHITFYKGGVSKSLIGQFSAIDDRLYIRTTTNSAIYLGVNNGSQYVFENNRLGINTNPSYPLHVTGTAVGNRIALFENGNIENNFASDIPFFHSRASVFGSFGVNSSGNMIIGVSPSATVFQLSISSTNNNVGIGTVTPVASAILDLTSTTKGFKLPVMTSTQASAISSPAKSLMLYVTDTNGTFTSAGWWGYNGTIWKLILAE